ncbi:MAG: baseplate J/gp47 family protein [Acidithiobacillus sp.]
MSIPLVMTAQGPVPTAPSTLQTNLITAVAAEVPDYTANLPGSLIEDISSTDVGALVVMDQARVDSVNNVSPYAANAYVLAQLGAQFGLPQGLPTNTNVNVVFSGPAGYVIPPGFIVGDGTYQYLVQNGTVIGTSGSSQETYCVANQSGSWAVPEGTVTQLVTSVPTGYTITVTNPQAGVPGLSAESVQSYRSRVLLGGQAIAQGFGNFLTTQLQAVSGVTPRLVSVRQVNAGWQVICGGGDPVEVAGAIYLGVIDLSTIVGSSTSSRNVVAQIVNPPNTYSVVYINPPQQVVTMTVTWNTTLANFTASSEVNQLAAPAIQSLINSIQVGQPINEMQMIAAFQGAVSSVLSAQYLTTLTFAVSINGVPVSPETGTQIIVGDPESYFYASATGITVQQG